MSGGGGAKKEAVGFPKVVFFLVFYNVFCNMVVPTSTCFQVSQLGAKMGLRWPTRSAKLTNMAPRCLQDRPTWTLDGAKLANLAPKWTPR